MRVALIQPDTPQSEDEILLGLHPPIGLAWLAGNISQHHVTVLDLRCEEMHIDMHMDTWDVVGLSCQTVSLEACNTVAHAIREELPSCIIVAGGHHPLPHELLCFSDYVVQGEGEIIFSNLLSCLDRVKDPSKIPGLYSHTVSTPPGGPADITRLRPPAYGVLALERYHPHEGCMVTSRGCPFTCVFCTHPFGYHWRGRLPHQVITEAQDLLSRGAGALHILDDLFTWDHSRVSAICEGFRSLQIQWDLPNGTRADTVNQEVLNTMARSGCTRLLYGIESGVPKILQSMKKDLTLETIEKAIKMTKKEGIEVEGLFMVGNPGDTWETIKKTVEFAKNLDIKGHFSLATPYPGTAFWRWVEQHGRFLQVPYAQFEQVPVFETDDFSAQDRLQALRWAQQECV
ncbi:MAG: radical SAM protein [Theionarchaea archaeon]|nr:radical SAM protein [Theionarchaea archaeon]